jgi:hypothetical protein
MEAVNDDDEAMMAMMGMAGFGSTKVLISLHICGSFFFHAGSPRRVSTSLETRMVLPMSRNREHGDST